MAGVYRSLLAALPLAALPLLVFTTPALATNETTSLYATTCSPYVVGGCDTGSSSVPLANGLNVGGGYAFASGYLGGLAIASAGFAPGAAPLLEAGTYQNGAIAHYTYTFRVEGAPDTLVPLHLHGLVSTSAIHLTDKGGNVVNLADGLSSSTPTDRWNVVANAYLTVVPTRLTPYPPSSAGGSVEGQYGAYFDGTSFCQNCDGGSTTLDRIIWFYSNSDINVTLDANVLLKYMALGDGRDPTSTFGNVSATADPTFTIDDPDYSAFSIVGLPSGVLPASAGAVPEPTAWAMMIAGFGMIGVSMRRRQRNKHASSTLFDRPDYLSNATII